MGEKVIRSPADGKREQSILIRTTVSNARQGDVRCSEADTVRQRGKITAEKTAKRAKVASERRKKGASCLFIQDVGEKS